MTSSIRLTPRRLCLPAPPAPPARAGERWHAECSSIVRAIPVAHLSPVHSSSDAGESIADADVLTAATWSRPGVLAPGRVARSKKIDLQTKEGVAAVKGSGGITTSRSSRSKARAPTANPTRRTTSNPGPEGGLRRQQVGVDRARELERPAPPARSVSAGIGSRSRFRRKPPARRSSSRRPSTTTARSGSTASCPAHPAKGARRSSPASTPPIASSSRTPAGQGLPDRRLRHQRADLGGAVQLAVPQEHGSRNRGQAL